MKMTKRRNCKKFSRLIKNNDLRDMKTLPTNSEVLQRRMALQNINVGKKKSKFLFQLSHEIRECWQKQDMPVKDVQTIYTKIRRGNIPQNDDLFDCLPTNPVWKTKEDKEYYFNQQNGYGGYCTSKQVHYSVHPSRRIKPATTEVEIEYDESDNSESESLSTDMDVYRELPCHENSELIGDVKFAEQLREAANLSISQTIAVMNFYKISFPDLEELPTTPSRSSLSVSSRKECERLAKSVECNDNSQILYFDMKPYNNLYGAKREILCVCAGNQLIEFTEIPNKKAITIVTCILNLIKNRRISTIVSDTEPTITGTKNGVVAIIKKEYPTIVYEPCRFHLLELILKNQIIFFLGKEKSVSPQISFPFVADIKNRWTDLRKEYLSMKRMTPKPCSDLPNTENRRDDYRYLLELCKGFRTFKECGDKPFIKIPSRPINSSTARWNSKAIYCLMHELIAGNSDDNVHSLNTFIAYEWAPVWFGVRNIADWTKLQTLCDKSKVILNKYGLNGKIEINPCTNEMAERVFRLTNEKIPRYGTVSNLRNAMIRYVNLTRKLNES